MKPETFQETFQRLSKPLILESQSRETLSNAPYRAWKVCLSKTTRLAKQNLESLRTSKLAAWFRSLLTAVAQIPFFK